MAVGRHMTKADWDQLAFNLYQQYTQLQAAAANAAAVVAPIPAATLAANTGYTVQEATDLISGVNVLKALMDFSTLNVAAAAVVGSVATQAATGSQAQVALGKFGGA